MSRATDRCPSFRTLEATVGGKSQYAISLFDNARVDVMQKESIFADQSSAAGCFRPSAVLSALAAGADEAPGGVIFLPVCFDINALNKQQNTREST